MTEEYIQYLKAYKPDEILIAEDDTDQDFFCLLTGKVGIWKGDVQDRESMVKIGEITDQGTYFGEMSMLLQEKRTASIIAHEPVKVLKFPGDMLSQLMLKQPKLGLKLCTALADRLKGTTSKQQDIALQRNEIRDDATQQFLQAKEAFQKLFVMVTAVQAQLQHPILKSVVEYMATDNMMQGGRKIRFDETFVEDMPSSVTDLVKKAYSENFS